jgi:hypothetical protein
LYFYTIHIYFTFVFFLLQLIGNVLINGVCEMFLFRSKRKKVVIKSLADETFKTELDPNSKPNIQVDSSTTANNSHIANQSLQENAIDKHMPLAEIVAINRDNQERARVPKESVYIQDKEQAIVLDDDEFSFY